MNAESDQIHSNHVKPAKPPARMPWIWDVLMIGILLIGAWFRFTGLDWDTNYHLHPDERFLTMVETAITPVETLADYFNTGTSTLNPNNRGYTFYVYGTLPIFIVRYVGELFGMTGYDKIHLVGRAVSGAFDLGTIILIYLIGKKLYKNSRLGLLAALFSAMAVLQIQLSHYFTVDNVANFFAYAAIYMAVSIMMSEPKQLEASSTEDTPPLITWKTFLTRSDHLGKYLSFGLFFGMALASKVSIYALAFLLPLAAAIYFSKISKTDRNIEMWLVLRNLVLAGAVAVITFRVFQPYAFLGPGFFGLKINQGWINSLKELSVISKGDVDVPYALQWARRPITFALENLTQWGLGLSLGVLSLFGFLWMGWRILKGDWQKHILIWAWAAFILVTQSINWVRSMRYLLPLYPILCLIAAWAIFKLWENGAGAVRKITLFNFNWRRSLAILAAVITIGGTAAWAVAFTSIYTRPVTRVAASEWIYENISSAIEVPITEQNGNLRKQLMAYQNTVLISSTQPYTIGFTAARDGSLQNVTLEHVLLNIQNNPELTSLPEFSTVFVVVRDATENDNAILTTGRMQSNFAQSSDPRGAKAEIIFDPVIQIKAGHQYALEISVVEPGVLLKLDGGIWITSRSTPIDITDAGLNGSNQKQLLVSLNSSIVSSINPMVYGFTAKTNAPILKISLEHVVNIQTPESVGTEDISLLINLTKDVDGIVNNQPIGVGFTKLSLNAIRDGQPVEINFDSAIQLETGQEYELEILVSEPDIILQLDGGIWLSYLNEDVENRQYLPPPAYRITETTPFQTPFFPQVSGTVSMVRLNRVVDLLNLGENHVLTLIIKTPANADQIIAQGSIRSDFMSFNDPRGVEYWIELDHPIQLDTSTMYVMELSMSGDGALALYNDAPAVESTWDDALPLGMYGYNLFGYESGIYGNVRNLELYYDDTQYKKDLLYTTLDQSDAIFISSNRQWGTITRVSERYPLTTEYYRALIGCPVDQDILWCYQVAGPGMFKGELGFELTAIFQSDPTIAGIEINDQAAEEAFTVYDHPKVLIFEKTDDYDGMIMRSILDKVDITQAVHKTPGQASRFSGNLMLGEQARLVQQTGGTWNELFPADSILNTKPWVAAVVLYLVIALLGLMVYPFVRTVFSGLPDKGYPFSRLTGLILTAYLTWLASSTFLTFSRLTIIIVLAILLLVSFTLAFRQRHQLLEEIRTRKKYFLTVELLMLVLFMISLAIRLGNPDLWHPWKGGEKPMDLSYFTAVLKSTVFPPYDPWYAGGYINYYYYGFVLVGVPVKLLGILPGIAYNLILPTLFALTGLGAFSVGWNLFAKKRIPGDEDAAGIKANTIRSNLAGFISVFTVLIMGNLGTLRMLGQGLQRLVAPGGVINEANLGERFIWFFQGLVKFLSGTRLPYGYGDWYWIPSRALPNEPITEFPFFTFTYADLHAHMIALPVTILIIGWGLGILLGKWDWKNVQGIKPWVTGLLTLVMGGLTIGLLRAANTWDFPTYLLLSCLVILFTIIRYAEVPSSLMSGGAKWFAKLVYIIGTLGLLVSLTMLFYMPFTKNFGQAYGSINLWTIDHSPLSSYLVHWGVQLFIIISWLVWETREWLAATPLSSLMKLRPYAGLLQTLVVLFGLVLLMITILGVKIGWLAGILGAWALVLMLRPNQPDSKRLVLFMTGTALVLTLFVELFVLLGDIGRMNTVFKFYFQAWTLFGLSAAAALVWLIPAVTTRWRTTISAVWQVFVALFIFGALLYPITAATDKVRDRMSQDAPRSLNGLEFMTTSRYFDQNVDMDLSQDYKAIQWMQQNVTGSPVIVEANTVEYRWGNRFTIYTGLPGVLGWNWHQRQQRGFIDTNGIANRLNDISLFYSNTEISSTLEFLKKYNVSYIILGQMERAYFPGVGLIKFEEYDSVYWKEVFREQDTVIYQVIGG